MSGFDFTGDYPSPIDEEAPEDYREPLYFAEGFDAKVDYWMNVRGFTREEAEQRVMTELLDDAA